MNKSDIKIIFTDIDWTLLDHSNGKHVYDKRSVKALKKAQKNGVLVYLATARPYDSVVHTGLLDFFTPDGIVCSNGSVAFAGDKLVRNDIFKHDEVKRIEQICNKLGIVIEVSTEKDRFFTREKNSYVDEYFKIFNETIPVTHPYKGENVSALLLFAPKEFDEQLRMEIGRNYDFYRFDTNGIDLRTHPIYKTQGINDVLNYLHISRENALAIGDDNSDAAMFEWVKYSACMGNGKDLAKYKAKFICKDVTHHGVKQTLKYYKII